MGNSKVFCLRNQKDEDGVYRDGKDGGGGEAGFKGNPQCRFRGGSFRMSDRQVEMLSGNLLYKVGGNRCRNKLGVPGSGIESCGSAWITWRVSAVRKDSALGPRKIAGEGGRGEEEAHILLSLGRVGECLNKDGMLTW